MCLSSRAFQQCVFFYLYLFLCTPFCTCMCPFFFLFFNHISVYFCYLYVVLCILLLLLSIIFCLVIVQCIGTPCPFPTSIYIFVVLFFFFSHLSKPSNDFLKQQHQRHVFVRSTGCRLFCSSTNDKKKKKNFDEHFSKISDKIKFEIMRLSSLCARQNDAGQFRFKGGGGEL